jgi:hypothetical protein
MILIMDSRHQKDEREHQAAVAQAIREAASKPPQPAVPAPPNPPAENSEEAVTFSPCGLWADYPPQVVVIQGADMPSLAMSGWEMDCPPPWSLAGKLEGNIVWPLTPEGLAAKRRVDAGFCLLIVVQWFLVAGFSLSRSNKLWAGPESLITACSIVACALALIPSVDGAARMPALIAMLGWYAWFGLLFWRAVKTAWRFVASRKPAPA